MGFSLARSRSGAAAAEFAFVLPVLLLLMFGTFQTGLLMFSYNKMINAARDTARAMAVCTITDSTTATNQVLKNLPAWVPASGWTITPTFGSDVSVSVSVDPRKAAVISYVPFSFGTLTAAVTMRKEPLAFGAGSCTSSGVS